MAFSMAVLLADASVDEMAGSKAASTAAEKVFARGRTTAPREGTCWAATWVESMVDPTADQ